MAESNLTTREISRLKHELDLLIASSGEPPHFVKENLKSAEMLEEKGELLEVLYHLNQAITFLKDLKRPKRISFALSESEISTVIAALRLFQEKGNRSTDYFCVYRALTNSEIDELCERLNWGEGECVDDTATNEQNSAPRELTRLQD